VVLACQPKDPPLAEQTTDTGDTSGTTGAPTSSGSTTFVDPTKGEPLDPDATPAQLCVHFCDRLVACELDGQFDECPCYPESLADYCVAEWHDMVACFDEAACTDLQADDAACWTKFQHAYEKCLYGADGCVEFIDTVINPDSEPQPPGTCAFGRDCLDMPTREVSCVGDTCTCTIDDKEVGTCPGDGVCETDDLRSAKIDECCG